MVCFGSMKAGHQVEGWLYLISFSLYGTLSIVLLWLRRVELRFMSVALLGYELAELREHLYSPLYS